MKQVIDLVTGAGLTTQTSQDNGKTVIGLIGDTEKLVEAELTALEGVEKSVRISLSYKLTSRLFHPENTVVDVNGVKIGDGSMTMMAGPCSIESLDQIRECARIAKAGGATILRGGAFKPRTSPYAFQGLEEEGLKYIRQAADELDMQVITEVMDEWLNAAEYIAAQGNFNVIFIERGIRTYETATRNTLDLSAVPLIKKLSHFPIIVDPSHGVGIWDLVPPMARAGVASGADGLIVEIHPDPANAWSDGPQSLNEKTYLRMMKEVHIIEKAMKEINALED